MPEPPEASARARIYTLVALIPAGRVATYGQIADLAGLPRQARRVGFALAALPPENDVPWHRVVNARGKISLPDVQGLRQRRLLEVDGIRFDAAGRIDLSVYRWQP